MCRQRQAAAGGRQAKPQGRAGTRPPSRRLTSCSPPSPRPPCSISTAAPGLHGRVHIPDPDHPALSEQQPQGRPCDAPPGCMPCQPTPAPSRHTMPRRPGAGAGTHPAQHKQHALSEHTALNAPWPASDAFRPALSPIDPGRPARCFEAPNERPFFPAPCTMPDPIAPPQSILRLNLTTRPAPLHDSMAIPTLPPLLFVY